MPGDEEELENKDSSLEDSHLSTQENVDDAPVMVEHDDKKDRISKELAAIRKRRTNTEGNRFPAATEDYVLLVGI